MDTNTPGHGGSRLVIFDLDGTVVDTLPATFRCFQEAVGPHLGRTPSPEEILERFGPADHHIVADWVGHEHAEVAIQRLYACYENLFAETGPFPGMVELIRALRQDGRQTALFTGRGRPSTEVILDAMQLRPLFDATVTGEEVPRSKPFPDGILKILDQLKAEPEAAVYVGDTVLDIEAARAAGVAPVAVVWGSPQAEVLFTHDVPCARSVSELRRMLMA